MASLYYIPNWFFTTSIIFEIIFAVVTGLVAVLSFKVYNLSRQKEFRLFGLGFTFISLSYIIWSLINLFLLDQLSDALKVLSFNEFVSLGALGIYFYMLLFIVGLATLNYTTLKENSKSIYIIILLISLVGIITSFNKGFTFQILSSIFLAFLLIHFASQVKRNKNVKSLLVFFAFLSLLVSHVIFIFSTSQYMYYVMGHIFELVAYILILARLYIIIK
ncbi:hypothetical protein COU56_02530 [Candidatus Pacearchaeota archaeon CG10_big_fil_rev_8_21_14_0_10_31_9]|nr:MAG: hypothetical protein AUJ62_00810 [Candidatus Pacearchaeota archaeon CG1_02_32_21]PIN94488.1 MAG: hypothetical protein COU56_02530 [Candidatus Pacearchaeota archaeon CG10_big_fil_rev_8_21_14_0_10_31_9]PIZ83823.1 MAG: hypothetical protein COX97_00395 [Candidatus Pacearchaeota archaeon CG_4_10_14_0_2_um_filter_05_32_18]